jgi:Ca-activated chloride channel family protein
MIRRSSRGLAGIVVAGGLILGSAAPAGADGILIPEPAPEVLARPAAFSVERHNVTVSIDGQTARTTIDQIFVNPNDVDLEGTYLFPIPESASIRDFSMWIDGRRVDAELLEASEARRIYEEIVRRTRDPGLLEYAGLDLFRARVYPIPKHGRTRFQLAYDELLPYDGGLVAYRYPLATEKFSAGNLDRVSIDVDIRADAAIKNVYSPSHDADIHIDGRTARCGYEASDVKPDRDFLLYYSVSRDDVGLSLLTHRTAGEDGYFALLLAPGSLDPATVIPKDVVFVIDVSGSMAGPKIEQARGALEFCLRRLNADDRFNVITFATSVDAFAPDLVPFTPGHLTRALRFVSRIEARGGTAIDRAMIAALAGPESENPRRVVFLSDGEPTVGETNVDVILADAGDANRDRARIFAFGVGHDVNTRFLDRLAAENGGAVEYVGPGEDIETRVAGFFTKISNAILSDPAIDFGDIPVRDLYPVELPDVFDGSQLVLFGRYAGAGATSIRLRGRVPGGDRVFTYEERFDERNEGNEFLPRLWASRKIAYLMGEIRLHGDRRELVNEVIRLSKDHGIITPYTSFLIVEEQPELLSRIPLPASDAARIRQETGRAMREARGAESFELSDALGRDQKSTTLRSPALAQVRHVGTKTFYASETGWTDSECEEGAPVREVRFLSPEYFDLLRTAPEVGRYLSLGSRVTFTLRGTAYRIVA